MCNKLSSVTVLVFFTLIAFFTSCTQKTTGNTTSSIASTEEIKNDITPVALPQKTIATSMKMSDSPITPENIDAFLFRNDCLYIDVRTPEAFYKEGHIAGFTNIPFYDYIAGFPGSHKPLFEMTRQGGTYLGDTGSYIANYEESGAILGDMLDTSKNIIVISTAGVESCYFLNLLVQLGYNPEKLYNAGSFTNGMGSDIAYRTFANARYLVSGLELSDTNVTFTLSGLTPKR
ncbi:MAG: hypothetical protein K6E51_07475 [Treponema sp.]|nr:hypothetical protein [Treponema sp.]